jgi:hypothetical protein
MKSNLPYKHSLHHTTRERISVDRIPKNRYHIHITFQEKDYKPRLMWDPALRSDQTRPSRWSCRGPR